MPSADKRQRKKENARAARDAREAEIKKRRRNRTIRNAVLAGVAALAVILVVTWVGGGDKKKATSTTTTTTATGVKCTDTKPAASTKNQNQKPPPMTVDTKKTYTAVMSTSCGDITIALDAKNAPKGVNNFVFLARQGFYDGLTFHRVVKGFVIQGGDPKGDGTGSPGYEDVVTELPKNGYPLGTLAYAKTGTAPAGSAGSQFFVVTSDRPAALEQKQNGTYQYGVFGHVTKGIDVAQKLEGFAPTTNNGDGPPTRSLYILKVTITEK